MVHPTLRVSHMAWIIGTFGFIEHFCVVGYFEGKKRVKWNVKGITRQAIFSQFIAIGGNSVSNQPKHP